MFVFGKLYFATYTRIRTMLYIFQKRYHDNDKKFYYFTQVEKVQQFIKVFIEFRIAEHDGNSNGGAIFASLNKERIKYSSY